MSRLAEVLNVSLSNATGLIDRIEERGFVERTRVPEDRRIVLIRVTDAGERMLGEIDALSDELLRSVLDHLDRSKLAGRPSGRRIAARRADRRHRRRHQPSAPTEGLITAWNASPPRPTAARRRWPRTRHSG